jgi:hypothetical protein
MGQREMLGDIEQRLDSLQQGSKDMVAQVNFWFEMSYMSAVLTLIRLRDLLLSKGPDVGSVSESLFKR